jgi:hypothetical protein
MGFPAEYVSRPSTALPPRTLLLFVIEEDFLDTGDLAFPVF